MGIPIFVSDIPNSQQTIYVQNLYANPNSPFIPESIQLIEHILTLIPISESNHFIKQN
jgi:hypothetical protein